MKYEQFEHTGDIGIKIYGDSLEMLFVNAGFAFFDLITDYDKIVTNIYREVEISAGDQEELLVNWLSELNFLFQTEYLLVNQFDIQQLTDKTLKARIGGQIRDPAQHPVHLEIKAVTFHYLMVKQEAGHWIGRVIFDI